MTYGEYLAYRRERNRVAVYVVAVMLLVASVAGVIVRATSDPAPKRTPAEVRAAQEELGIGEDGRYEPAVIAHDAIATLSSVLATGDGHG